MSRPSVAGAPAGCREHPGARGPSGGPGPSAATSDLLSGGGSVVSRFHRQRSDGRPRARALVAPVSALLAGFVLSLGTTVVGARPVASALTRPSPPSVPTLPTIPPVMSCSALMGVDFSRIPDAPASLTSATPVGSGQGQYCDVK